VRIPEASGNRKAEKEGREGQGWNLENFNLLQDPSRHASEGYGFV